MALGTLALSPSLSAQRPSASTPEGGTVEYELASSFTAPDGSYHQATTSRLRLAFDGSTWSGTCTGTTTETWDGRTTTSSWAVASGGQPAVAPTDARRGSIVDLPLLGGADVAEGCRQRGETVQVAGHRRQVTSGVEPADTAAYQDVSVRWERDTGLVLDWSRLVGSGTTSGRASFYGS